MLIFIISILFACTHLSADEYKIPPTHILNTIQSIPEKDRKEIKALFNNLFKTHTFAYSLYGDKPLSYGDVSLEEYSLLNFWKTLPIDQCCKEILEIYSEPTRSIIER